MLKMTRKKLVVVKDETIDLLESLRIGDETYNSIIKRNLNALMDKNANQE